MKRVRIARSWGVRFDKLSDRMTKVQFCGKHDFNVFTMSRYINQSLKAVKALGDKKPPTEQIYLASWDYIQRMNDALAKEGV